MLRSQSTQNDEAEIYLTDRRDLESEQWQLLPTKDEGVMLTGTSH